MQLEREITGDGDLLDPRGELREVGWSRGARLRYERSAVRASLQRIKEWEHYTVQSPEVSVSLTLAQLGVVGGAHVEVLSLPDGHADKGLDLFLPTPQGLPNSPYLARTFEKRTRHVCFSIGPQRRAVSFAFDGASPLRGEIELTAPSQHEGLAVVTPFPANGLFFYEYKVPDLVVSGWLETRGRRHTFEPATTRAVMDWGRGAWPKRSRWRWGWAAGTAGGKNVSLNLGDGFGDMSAASENAAVVDGTLHKLGRVRWSYDPGQRMRPWRFEDDAGRLSLEFSPECQHGWDNNLILWSAHLDKVYGSFRGTLVLDDGERIAIDGITGFAEEMTQRW